MTAKTPEKEFTTFKKGKDQSEISSSEVSSHSIADAMRNKVKNVSHPLETSTKNRFKSEVLTSAEITEEKIREISDFFRLIFNNDWPEFVVCPPCDTKLEDGMKFSASQVYGTGDQPVPVETIDIDQKVPNCPNCVEKMKIFHDPRKTFQKLKERLEKDGYLSLLRDMETNEIEGLVYGYGCTLKEQFESEWGNRYVYMAEQFPEYDRSFDRFLECLNDTFPDENFGPDKEVFCWNCVATSHRARGNLKTLILNFLDAVPSGKHDLYNIGETEIGSKFHQILLVAGSVDIKGFLGGGEVLTGNKFGNYVKGFKNKWLRSIK